MGYFKKLDFSGSDLKLIAITTMLIDHLGAIILEPLLNNYQSLFLSSLKLPLNFWLSLNFILRAIGRLAFPLFAFLLVEGFKHTRDPMKYFWRLAVFALLSEIPFDLATSSNLFNLNYQNVFFTLALGLLTLILFNSTKKKGVQAFYLGLGVITAHLLESDYGGYGIILIFLFHLFRDQNRIKQACLAVWLSAQLTAPLSLLLIWRYNGQRGLNWRYFFYLFYPLHLLLLYLIRLAITNALL